MLSGQNSKHRLETSINGALEARGVVNRTMANRGWLLGGGGGTHYRVRPPKPILEASESGIGLVLPVSSKENDRAWTNGGQNVSLAGGPKLFWGRGFMVCLPSLEFSTLCSSLSKDKWIYKGICKSRCFYSI